MDVDESDITDDEIVEFEEPDEDIEYGQAFEKTMEYNHFLDQPNPWHSDLKRKLFNSQIICFRWMCDRHRAGGGIVGDKVGVGKVQPIISFFGLTNRPILR